MVSPVSIHDASAYQPEKFGWSATEAPSRIQVLRQPTALTIRSELRPLATDEEVVPVAACVESKHVAGLGRDTAGIDQACTVDPDFRTVR